MILADLLTFAEPADPSVPLTHEARSDSYEIFSWRAPTDRGNGWWWAVVGVDSSVVRALGWMPGDRPDDALALGRTLADAFGRADARARASAPLRSVPL